MNRPDAMGRLRLSLEACARDLGFADLRIAPAAAPALQRQRLGEALRLGHMASMAWMADTQDRRADPLDLWPEARTAICLAFAYTPEEEALAATRAAGTGAISVYARGRDYHDVVKGLLKQLAGRLMARAGELGVSGAVKVFVDTAPVMEKPLAERAGLGWQGKHTNLVSRRIGSWFFLAEILTSFDLPVDAPEADHCGSCTACQTACPTDAFPRPYQLDARRCISYLTIEHDGPIDPALRPLMGNRIYGCDDCLAACPWNKFAVAATEAKLRARDDLLRPPLAQLAGLDDTAFRQHFSGSPIKRSGRNRFLRNVLIAIGNSGDTGLAEAATPHLIDPAPMVRGAAVWALSRLLPRAVLTALHRADDDPTVAAEWAAALQPAVAVAADQTGDFGQAVTRQKGGEA